MAAKLLLPLLSASVFYAIFYFATVNGLRGLADQSIASGTLPGTDKWPLRTVYTGIGKVDELLTILTTFFWPVTDGAHPALLLHSIAFSGTFCSAWVLVTLESWRKGNNGTILAIPSIFGLAAQALTFAFATPLYCAVQVHTSVTASKPSAQNLRVPISVLRALPFAFAVGMLLPSTLMTLPISATITPDVKQILIAIWQPWPVYVAILLRFAHTAFSSSSTGRTEDSPENTAKGRRSLRFAYAFAFANTAIPHIVTLTVSLATVAAPAIFDAKYREALHPLNVFHTPLPWKSPVVQVATVGEGVHGFLRWDYLIGTTGVLVWALSLYRTAHRLVYGRVDNLGLLLKTAWLTVLAGPVGAAVELMWERDELVFHASNVKSEARKT
ncbi:hypothetical protein JDV02_007308 [Purpureocillium takamizusanense]|uniref:AtmA protein n=1 Tax=Purpureocillium takamizusanense TaxID=2060973 RepID=A0A9Q8QMS4_9HYPO|nr:uncharacterized protein JDV02_007308 [Purpureocillium takamizusanense]UNI21307.1 hypothetical protein JDV02_007308 [Purpureocillium takamizusanense]